MTESSYDGTILEHYREVAASAGSSSSSTMLDEVIRSRETAAIKAFVSWVGAELGRALEVVDVGCGNGFTIETLARSFPRHGYTGFEFTPELLELAVARLEPLENAAAHPGDIRDAGFVGERTFDLLLCQRVLINLLSPEDQRAALEHLVSCVRPGGFLMFVEAFGSPLENLNEARAELELEAIAPAHHNLYLPDDFFTDAELEEVPGDAWGVAQNHLSTHYYVSRVLAPWAMGDKPFKRNAEIQKFFSTALPPGIGNYSPLLIFTFRRKE